MDMLTRICGLLCVFGALNWVALSMFEKDAITVTMGTDRTIGTDGLHIVVGLAALYVLLQTVKRAKKK